MKITSKLFQSLFIDLGIAVVPKLETDSPLCKLFHFNVCQIKDITSIPKHIPTIAKFLKIDVQYEESSIAHFALRLNKTERQLICFNDDFYSQQVCFNNDKLQIFAGVDAENKVISFNLQDMPHLLIAGTTGSGKSVMLNTVICSLMKSNETILFDFIDTKRVELSKFKTIKNARFAPTCIDALNILADICEDIEYRYSQMEEDKNSLFFKRVVIIDELNDLMITNKKAIEPYIIKIAQLGRACGVHLVVATQRPVVATLTGDIKANIDCRIALKTASAIDSRNILGHNGAEKLNGKGDALLKLPSYDNEIHIQCPFINETEINNMISLYNQKSIFINF